MTNPTPLTSNELKALAYFAVGVTSEGSLGGRDVSYRLSFAGNIGRDGLMDPVGNSGYSFGTLQVDIGQHPDVAPRLLDAYQAWAAKQPDRDALEMNRAQYQSTLTALQRDGHAMEDARAHDIDRSRINRFLASSDGRAFVHTLDTQHVNGVTAVDARLRNGDSALERLERTALYRNADDEEQARLASMFMKLQNQSDQRYAPRLLARVEAGELTSAADVKTAINGLMRNPAKGGADYIESGADNTLRGAALFNTVRSASAENPIAQAWAAVVANPLVGPVAAHNDARRPELGSQYDTIRSLFLRPEASQRLVHALDRGGQLAEGDPALHNGQRRPGFFVSGHDFVHWGANGMGVACIGGQWRSVDPDRLHRVANRDGTFDLRLTENGRTTTLLHVDPRSRTTAMDDQQSVQSGATVRTEATGSSERSRTILADDPSHPNHAAFDRIHSWVRRTGQWNDEQSLNVSAALYREQVGDPLVQRIDSVTGGLGRDGAQNVFAVYAPTGPGGLTFHVHVDGREASRQPALANLEQAEQIVQAQQRASQQEQALTMSPRAISLSPRAIS